MCHTGITHVSHMCHTGVTQVSHRCHTCVTQVSQMCDAGSVRQVCCSCDRLSPPGLLSGSSSPIMLDSGSRLLKDRSSNSPPQSYWLTDGSSGDLNSEQQQQQQWLLTLPTPPHVALAAPHQHQQLQHVCTVGQSPLWNSMLPDHSPDHLSTSIGVFC
jgi:hypothetical protein